MSVANVIEESYPRYRSSLDSPRAREIDAEVGRLFDVSRGAVDLARLATNKKQADEAVETAENAWEEASRLRDEMYSHVHVTQSTWLMVEGTVEGIGGFEGVTKDYASKWKDEDE